MSLIMERELLIEFAPEATSDFSFPSERSAVVSPVQQHLALLFTAGKIARLTVLLQLGNVPSDGFPAPDLTLIIGTAAPHVVAAVPLKPAPGVFVINPAFHTPVGQRLGSVDAEAVQSGIMVLMAKPGSREPVIGKLITAIRHVLAAENAQCKHFLRRQVGFEVRVEVLSDRFNEKIDIILLHQVIDDDSPSVHRCVLPADPARSGQHVLHSPCRQRISNLRDRKTRVYWPINADAFARYRGSRKRNPLSLPISS